MNGYVFYMAAMTAIVALQVWAQFIVQTAAVVPGYARPHQVAALIISLGGILVGAAGLWWSGIAVLPGLVIAAALPAAVLTILCASQSHSQSVRNFVVLPIIVGMMLIWYPMFLAELMPPVIAGE